MYNGRTPITSVFKWSGKSLCKILQRFKVLSDVFPLLVCCDLLETPWYNLIVFLLQRNDRHNRNDWLRSTVIRTLRSRSTRCKKRCSTEKGKILKHTAWKNKHITGMEILFFNRIAHAFNAWTKMEWSFDLKAFSTGVNEDYTAAQRQTAVTAYLESKQLQLFVFAEDHAGSAWASRGDSASDWWSSLLEALRRRRSRCAAGK